MHLKWEKQACPTPLLYTPRLFKCGRSSLLVAKRVLFCCKQLLPKDTFALCPSLCQSVLFQVYDLASYLLVVLGPFMVSE